jgi:hypothetical protein
MFKAAFPWASAEEEANERRHHKTLMTGSQEVAGNVWISPEEGTSILPFSFDHPNATVAVRLRCASVQNPYPAT